MTARVTRITATRPATLSKSFRRDANGSLVRGGGGVLVEGHAAVRQIAGLPAVGALLTSLGPAEALVYGVPRTGDGPLLSRNVFAARGRPASAITRTREWFQWPKGPGVMMLDYDPEPEGAPLGRSALVSMIRDAVPGFADVSMLWWPSASSHIVDAQSGIDLTGLRGHRRAHP